MSEPNRLDVLRCADQDREVVATLLNTAYADGRLTFDEHAERIARAYDAKTFGDLNSLTTDLVAFDRPAPPAPMPHYAATPAPQPTPHVPAAPAYGALATGAFTGGNSFMSTYNPGRVGLVASTVNLNAWLGEIRLDLIGAAFEQREVNLHVGGGMCEVKIRVPEGVDVNVSGMSLIMAESKVQGLMPRPDGIRINLIGTVFMGEVKVYGPGMDRRRYERFIR